MYPTLSQKVQSVAAFSVVMVSCSTMFSRPATVYVGHFGCDAVCHVALQSHIGQVKRPNRGPEAMHNRRQHPPQRTNVRVARNGERGPVIHERLRQGDFSWRHTEMEDGEWCGVRYAGSELNGTHRHLLPAHITSKAPRT